MCSFELKGNQYYDDILDAFSVIHDVFGLFELPDNEATHETH